MELREFIVEGEKKAGSLKTLGMTIGVHPNNLTNAKRGERGIPLAACYKLADLIGAPRDAVAASSEIVKEKDEKVREYLRPFAQNLGKAASIFMMIASSVAFSTAGNRAEAATRRTAVYDGEIFKVSAPAPEAAPMLGLAGRDDLYYVKFAVAVKRAIAAVCNKLASVFWRDGFASC